MDHSTGSRHHLESNSSSHSPAPELGEIDSSKASPLLPSLSSESVLSSLNGPLSVALPTQSLPSSHVYPQADELAGHDKGANRHFSWQAGSHSRDMPLEHPYHHHHHNDNIRVRDTSPFPQGQTMQQPWMSRADGHQHSQHDRPLIQRHPYPVTERRRPSYEQWETDDVPSSYRTRIEFQDVHNAQDIDAPGSARPHTHESNKPERELYAQVRPTFDTHEGHYRGRSPSQDFPSQPRTRSEHSNYRHTEFDYHQDVNQHYRGESLPYMFSDEPHSNSYRPPLSSQRATSIQPTQQSEQPYTGHPQSGPRRLDRSYPASSHVSRDRPHPYRLRNTSCSPEPLMHQQQQQHPRSQHYQNQGRVSPHGSFVSQRFTDMDIGQEGQRQAHHRSMDMDLKSRKPENQRRSFTSGLGIQRTNASTMPKYSIQPARPLHDDYRDRHPPSPRLHHHGNKGDSLIVSSEHDSVHPYPSTSSRQDTRGMYPSTTRIQHHWVDQDQRYIDQSGRSDGTISPYESTRDHVTTRAGADGLRSDYRDYDGPRVTGSHKDGNLDERVQRLVFSPDSSLHVRQGRSKDWTRPDPENDLSFQRRSQHGLLHQDGSQHQARQHDPANVRKMESPPVRLHAQQLTTPVRSSPSQHQDYMSPCANSTREAYSSSSSFPTNPSANAHHDMGRFNYDGGGSEGRKSGHIHSPSLDQGSLLKLEGPDYHSYRDTNILYRRHPVNDEEGGLSGLNPVGGNDSGQRWGGANDLRGEERLNRVLVDMEGRRGSINGLTEQRRDAASDGKWKGKEKARDGRSPSTGLDSKKRSVTDTESGTEDTEEDAGHNDVRGAQEGMMEEEDGQGEPSNRELKRKGPANDTSRTNSSPEGGPPDDGGETTTGRPRGTRTKENRNHQCLACGKRFSRPSQLKTHSFTHSGERPHQCPTCQKFFNVPSNLKRHIRTHSADTKRKCSKTGSNVFRTFDHVYPTKLDRGSSGGAKSGNDNGDPASESLASSNSATAPRRQPSGHAPSTERLRWMNTETPFSGSIAANRKRATKKKIVRKQERQGQEQGQGSGSAARKQRPETLTPSSSSDTTLQSSSVVMSTVESATSATTNNTISIPFATIATAVESSTLTSTTSSATSGKAGSLHLIGAEATQELRAGPSSLPTLSVSGSPSSVSGDTTVDPTPESTSSDTEKED